MKKILLIIGAGSSKAIDPAFPLGVELAHAIDHHLITTKKKTNPPKKIKVHYLSSMINELNNVFKSTYNYDPLRLDPLLDSFKRKLWDYVQAYFYNDMRMDTPPISIDQLVSKINGRNKTQITDIAKFSIVYYLKGVESAFFDKFKADKEILTATWVYHFFEKLKPQYDSLEQILQCLHVRTFNYERLFEFCSKQSLSRLYNLPLRETNALKLNITPVYGNIGSLTQYPFKLENNKVPKLKKAHKSIKLIGEERESCSNFNICDYETVLFIGFGYNIENIEKALGIKKGNLKECHGMCYQPKDKSLVAIDRKYNIRIKHTQCIQSFIDDHITNCA